MRKERQPRLLERHLMEVQTVLGETGPAEYRATNRDWIGRIESGTLVILQL